MLIDDTRLPRRFALTASLSLLLSVAGVLGSQNALAQAEDSAIDQAEARDVQAPQPREFDFSDRVILFDEAFPYDEENPAVGHWHGNVRTPFGWPAAAVLISIDEEGAWSIETSVTPGAPPHQRGAVLHINGREISFRAPLDPPEAGALQFVGTVSEDGQRMAGRVIMPNEMIQQNLQFMLMQRQDAGEPEPTQEEINQLIASWREGTFELGRAPRPVDLPERYAFGGTIEVAEQIEFEVVLCFAETPGGNWVGHIDIPQQYVGGWILDRTSREGNRFTAHMGGGSPAVITADMSEDGQTIDGMWKYPNLDTSIEFKFSRIENYDGPRVSPPPGLATDEGGSQGARPQYPRLPYSYQTRELNVEHENNHVLSGTLSLPVGPGPHPAVILVSNSGPHDRDAVLFGHKWFLVLADRLTRQGIAVMRFDERGIGKSTGRFFGATMDDLASDVAAVYNFMRAIETIDADRIGLVGHGEGAAVAAIAAGAIDGPAFIALLAPSGQPGWEVQHDQMVQALTANPSFEAHKEVLQAMLAAHSRFLQGAAEDLPEEELLERATVLAEAEQGLADAIGAATTAPPERRSRMLLSMVRQPAFRQTLSYNPLIALTALECPVFAAWGTLDQIVDVDFNRPPIESALSESSASLHTFEGLNHLFQPAETGSPNEYGRIATTIDEQLLETLAEWLRRAADLD